jgi:hypothetical protein
MLAGRTFSLAHHFSSEVMTIAAAQAWSSRHQARPRAISSIPPSNIPSSANTAPELMRGATTAVAARICPVDQMQKTPQNRGLLDITCQVTRKFPEKIGRPKRLGIFLYQAP